MDYEGLNKALDRIDDVLNLIRREQHLEQDRIEQWNWGQPQITLSWRGDDDIWRNIHAVMLNPHEGVQSPCRIEVNAWRDMKEDRGWIRHWQHHPIIEEGQLINTGKWSPLLIFSLISFYFYRL